MLKTIYAFLTNHPVLRGLLSYTPEMVFIFLALIALASEYQPH